MGKCDQYNSIACDNLSFNQINNWLNIKARYESIGLFIYLLSRLSEESTCPSGIVHCTPVSQDSTGLAVTPNEEPGEN